jgi:TolB protein
MKNIKKHLIALIALPLLCVMNNASAKDELAYLAIDKDYWQVWFMDADGSNAHPVTHSAYDKSRLSFFPSGDMLVSGNQGELVRLSLVDNKETEIKAPFEQVNDAVISPDGKYMAFSQKPKGTIYNKLWLMEIKTGKKTKVDWSKGFQHEPYFSHDSQILYYLSGDNGQSHDIMKYKIKTKAVEPVTLAKLYNLDVAVNKKDQFVFSSNRSGNYEIWFKEKGKARQLTNHPALDGRPTFSADNKTVYFESNRGGSMNIWSVNTDGKQKAKQITKHKVGARYPLWRTK